jgi:hypothetical protein
MLVSSREDLDRFGPICSNVKEMCQFTRASLEGDVLPKGQLNKSEPTLPKDSMCVQSDRLKNYNAINFAETGID